MNRLRSLVDKDDFNIFHTDKSSITKSVKGDLLLNREVYKFKVSQQALSSLNSMLEN
ncbi:MAG: hypothetical protein ACLFMO_01720 [Eubacteriales bacterium]